MRQTVVYGEFEWSPTKAEKNLTKHGVALEEAVTAIVDPRTVFLVQDSRGERELTAIGISSRARLLAVVHVERKGRDRIVSARLATRTEEQLYAESD
jgi:hypothetical protein